MPYAEIKISCRSIHDFLWKRRLRARGWVAAFADLGIWPTDAAALLLPGIAADGALRFGNPADPWPDESVFPRMTRGLPDYSDQVFPDCVDVVKVDPKKPTTFRTMLRNCDWIGRGNLRFADATNESLRLAADPLDWLRLVSRGERAACWIGADQFAFGDRLRDLSKVICSNAAHAAAVYKAIRLERPRRFPELTFAIEESANVRP